MNNFDDEITENQYIEQSFDQNDINNSTSIEELERLESERLEEMDHKLPGLLTKLVMGLIAYMISFQLIAGIASRKLEMGVSLILGAVISIFFLKTIVKKPVFSQIFSYKKRDFRLSDVFFFFGMTMLINIPVNKLVSYILERLNIESIDVMDVFSNNMSPILILYVVLIGPLVEEIIYRGFLLQNLKDYSKQAALIVSTLAFALMHGNISQSLGVLGISFVFNYIGIFYSWKFAFVMHIINNFVAMTVTYLTQLTVEGDSPIAFWIIVAFGLVVLLSILYTFIKLIRGRGQEIRNDLKTNDMDRRYRNRIIFSLPILTLFAFYIALMVLTKYYENMV